MARESGKTMSQGWDSGEEDVPCSQDLEEVTQPAKRKKVSYYGDDAPAGSLPFSQAGDTNQNNNGQQDTGMIRATSMVDKDWGNWTTDQLADQLEQAGLSDVAKIFKEQEVVGWMLPKINDNDLEKYGILKLGKKIEVRTFIEKTTQPAPGIPNKEYSWKVFNDPIHGHIELHPLCVKIIDTPEFQRLRFLKQLGTCYFVYPGATHNRFEHSLGVCHLAGRLVEAIRSRQPELCIDDRDVLCVQIAGLCHDLGHGPFSHLFDGKFIPHVCPDTKWKHEDASRMMFDHMVKKNNLIKVFTDYGLTEQDLTFIKEQITGPKTSDSQGVWQYKGRPSNKGFLYEIVANKRNAIDVDKWDYFARDCHMLGIKNNFDHNRCIHFSRVLEVEGELQICSRDKEVANLYDMFYTRKTLHSRAYQHKTTNILDTMVTEAFIKANDHLKIPGSIGEDGKRKMLRMSEAIDDPEAFTKLTDHVFFLILHSDNSAMKESQEILGNILSRKLYKHVSQTQLPHGHTITAKDFPNVKDEIWNEMDTDERDRSPLKQEDITINLVYLDYGMKDKNPIDNVRFYSKDDPDKAMQIKKSQVSNLLPEKFAEQQIHIHYKHENPWCQDMVKRAFVKWCKVRGFPEPKGGNTSMDMTPAKGQSTPKNATPTTNSSCNVTPKSAGKFKSRLSFE